MSVGVRVIGLRPFFTYFGGKWRAAPRYPAPRYDTIVEPFAGGAGYALRHWQKRVILVDKDPVIAGLWSWLIRVSKEEILSLPIEVVDTRELTVCDEAKALIGFWLNKGTATPCHTPGKWMRDRSHPESFWGETIRARIAEQVEHIRHWRVCWADYRDLPNKEVTWFVDPPYEVAGRWYRFSNARIDYGHLASWCREREGQTIVCEQAGAAWLPFRPHTTIKALEGKHGKKTSEEVIWTNDASNDPAAYAAQFD